MYTVMERFTEANGQWGCQSVRVLISSQVGASLVPRRSVGGEAWGRGYFVITKENGSRHDLAHYNVSILFRLSKIRYYSSGDSPQLLLAQL